MGESLTQQRRVRDEGLRVVNLFSGEEQGRYLRNKFGYLRASSRGKT